MYFNGPEPERLRPLLDSLRALPPPTTPDRERMARLASQFFARLDALLEQRKQEPAPEQPPPPARSVKVTAPVLEIPASVRAQLGRLPFQPPAPGQKEKVKTLQVPVMRRGHGETAPLGDDAIEKARAVLPFARGAAPVVPTSKLTLQQHASLCCEIAEAPERAAEAMARYHVTAAEKEGADRHHAAWFAREPAARAAWDEAYRTYRVWWVGSRGRR